MKSNTVSQKYESYTRIRVTRTFKMRQTSKKPWTSGVPLEGPLQTPRAHITLEAKLELPCPALFSPHHILFGVKRGSQRTDVKLLMRESRRFSERILQKAGGESGGTGRRRCSTWV